MVVNNTIFPDFIIGGTAKSGSTFLDNLIRRHPQVNMIKRSMDISFFDDDNIYANGFEWYISKFQHLDQSKLIGQTSADCSFNPGSIEKIKNHLPGIKLIFIFRDPIDRVYSSYWHLYKTGRVFHNFENALEFQEKQRKKDYFNFKTYSDIGRSKYFEQTQVVESFFPQEQILYIPFEYLVKNTLEALNTVFRFLNVDTVNDLSDFNIENTPVNKTRIPKYRSIVWLSFVFRRLGFVRLSIIFANIFLSNDRPPKMSSETKKRMEAVLEKDLEFHKNLLKKYNM